MRRLTGYVVTLLLAAALVGSTAITGCTARASGTIKGARNIPATINGNAAGQAANNNNAQQNQGARGGK